MNDATLTTTPAPSGPVALPEPRVPVRVRPATMADLPFIDALQRLRTKQVGWMPTQQLEGKIRAGNALVAWAPVAWASRPCSSRDTGETPVLQAEPVGYFIGDDRYFKHDD